MLNETEIKKELYRKNPVAKLMYIRRGKAYYRTSIDTDDIIIFAVPTEEMGDTDFLSQMDAKHLIRWLK